MRIRYRQQALCGALIVLVAGGCATVSEERERYDARVYRLYHFEPVPALATAASDGQSQARYEVSYFEGLITQADVESVFGEQVEFSTDDAGNRISPVAFVDGSRISMLEGPAAINWLSVGPGGQLVSSIDVHKDGVIDLSDTVLPNLERDIIANDIGRELLEQLRRGQSPWCSELAGVTDRPLFGCGDDSGAGDGSAGGATGGSAGQGLADPFESICAEYRDASRAGSFGGGVYAHGGHGRGHLARTGGFHLRDNDEDNNRRMYFVGIQVHEDDAGNHVRTVRETRYYDEDHNVVRTIVETVDHDGNGERVVTDHGPGDRSTSRRSRFRTEVNEDGTYDTPTPFQDDDAPESHKRYFSEQEEEWQEEYDEAPNWPESITGETLPPDPGGDISGGWTEWCAATERDKRPGGVESVADADHGVFDREICLNDGTVPQDCITLNRSGIFDLESMLAPPAAGNNCGPYEQPGPDGTCGPARTRLPMLGGHMDLSAIDIEGIELCDPLVCNPGFLD